jgi:hypothetical protein
LDEGEEHIDDMVRVTADEFGRDVGRFQDLALDAAGERFTLRNITA